MAKEYEPFVDLQTAAKFLNVSKKTIRRYCASRNREPMPFYRPCTALRFRISEIARWAERTKGEKKRRRGRKPKVAKVENVGYASSDLGNHGAASDAREGGQ